MNIPVSPVFESKILELKISSRLKNVFRSSSEVSPYLSSIYCLIMDLYHSGNSEDSWHYIYDTRMSEIFLRLSKHCGINIRYDRNVSGSSSTFSTVKKNKRPDFLLWLSNGLLVLKGEEKRSIDDFGIAKEELANKSSLCHPFYIDKNFPYQLCYAAAEGMVQFFCLNLFDNNIEPISKLYNLSASPIERAEFLLAVITIFRVIRTLHNNITLTPKLILHNKIETNEGNTCVTFFEDHVYKVTSLYTGDCILDLYKKIIDNDTTNIVRPYKNEPPKSRTSEFPKIISLCLCPLGLSEYPSNLDQIKKAAVDTLTGMSYIHSFGFVVRDIRPQNVLRDIDGNYFLIDFEWAAPIGSHMGGIKFKLEPPEIAKKDSWELTADIWQFGMYIYNFTPF